MQWGGNMASFSDCWNCKDLPSKQVNKVPFFEVAVLYLMSQWKELDRC
jgi:hypothetical protein